MKDLPQNQDLDLIFVIDKSGSMWGSEKDTMGGFNAFIEKEKNKEFNTKVTTELTSKEYYVGGSTALLDAIGRTITSLNSKIENKVLFVVMTDGMENSSIEYSKKQIKNMISSHSWEFIFIGADIDSYGEAGSIGFKKSRIANYEKSNAGINDAYYSVACAADSMRKNIDLDDANWDAELRKYD